MTLRILVLISALALLIPGAPARAETPEPQHHVFLPRIVTPLPDVLFEAIPPGGDQLQIFKARADGRDRVMLTQPNQGRNVSARFSPDGAKIVFSSSRGNTDPTKTYTLYVMNADGSNQHRLSTATNETESNPVWSPDSTHLVFTAYNGGTKLYVIQADGTNEHQIGSLGAWQAQWSPDGKHLSFLQNGELHIVNADGSTDRTVASASMAGVWSSDGTKLLYSSPHEDRSSSRIATVSADGQTTQVLTDTAMLVISLDWSPDGERIAVGGEHWLDLQFLGRSAYLIHADGSSPVALPENSYLFGWSPDSTRIIYIIRSALVVADRSGAVVATLNPIGMLDRILGSPSWSRDGAWVSFTYLTYYGHLMQFTNVVVVSSDGITKLHPDEELTSANEISWR